MTADTLSLLVWLVPLLLLAGALAGMLAGLLGVGGGIVIVPALYHIFGYLDIDDSVRMHLAVGTSLATIIPTGFRSARAHAKRGSFDQELISTWTPAMITGVLLGTWAATLANFSVLTSVFAVVAMIVALYMGIGNPDWRLSNTLPNRFWRQPIAASIGAISAMMGIGGGTMGVPTHEPVWRTNTPRRRHRGRLRHDHRSPRHIRHDFGWLGQTGLATLQHRLCKLAGLSAYCANHPAARACRCKTCTLAQSSGTATCICNISWADITSHVQRYLLGRGNLIAQLETQFHCAADSNAEYIARL